MKRFASSAKVDRLSLNGQGVLQFAGVRRGLEVEEEGRGTNRRQKEVLLEDAKAMASKMRKVPRARSARFANRPYNGYGVGIHLRIRDDHSG